MSRLKGESLARRNAEIARLYISSTLTLREIGERFGISRQRVEQIGRRPVPLPRGERLQRRLTLQAAERSDEIESLALAGLSPLAIARRLGLPAAAVKAVMDGVDWRPACRCRLLTMERGSPKRCSDERLLELLREAAADSGPYGHLSSSDYRAWAREHGVPSVETVTMRFGSWNSAKAAASLPTLPHRRDSSRVFTDDDCLTAIRRCAEALGELPSASQYEAWRRGEPHVPSLTLLRIRYNGSWVAIRAEALGAAAAPLPSPEKPDSVYPASGVTGERR